MEKMTKMEMLAQIRSHLSDSAEIGFIDHEMELLRKKATRVSADTVERQAANAELRKDIVALISKHADGMTIADLRKATGYSSQKLTPQMRKLEADGILCSRMEKRVNVYTLAEKEDEDAE